MENKTKAVLLMSIAACGFAAMGVFVKLAGDLPVYEKVFFRNFVTLHIALLLLVRRHGLLFGHPGSRLLLTSRAVLGLVAVVLYFYAIDHLILADAVMLNNLSPFFVTLFALMVLSEKLTRLKTAALCIAFGGALFIIKPRFELDMLPVLAGLGSAVLAGAAYTIVRHLRQREDADTIVFYFSLISVLGMIPFIALDFAMPNATQWLWLACIGVSGALGQFGMTLAYRYAPAAEVAIYNYLTIIISAILGFMLWGEIPDIYSIMGGLLIVAAAWLVFRFDSEKQAPEILP